MEPGRKAIYGLFDSAASTSPATSSTCRTGRPRQDGEVIRFEVDVYCWRLAARASTRRREADADRRVGTLVVGPRRPDKVAGARYLLLAIGIGTACMLVMGLLGGHVMSRWTLGRIERINRTTAGIVAGDLGRRIELSGADDEFDELARHLNAMLERIDRLLAGMRQVTDDIAHDLRTPLTRMRSRIEVAMMSESAGSRDARPARGDAAGRDGLIETFNALLSIARVEAGTQRGEWEVVDLAALALDVHELYEPLAEEKGIALDLAAAPAPVETIGNGQLLAQAIANLVDNAIKHAPPGSRVAVRTTRGLGPGRRGRRRRARDPRRPARAGEGALRQARRRPLGRPRLRPRPQPRRRGGEAPRRPPGALRQPARPAGHLELPAGPAAADERRGASAVARAG
jgi:signal transduction histidine kinase